MPYRKLSVQAEKHLKKFLLFSKRTLVFSWFVLCVASLLCAFFSHNTKWLFLILLPPALLVSVWAGLFFLVVLHEAGHLLTGLLLGFPVTGFEIGFAPYKVIKLKKFTVRIGKFPRGGRTILGLTSRSYSRFKQFCFFSSGIVFQFLLLLILFFHVRFWLKFALIFVGLDELWVNFLPKYEQGHPANDGAFLLELLLPKEALKKSLK